MTNPYGQLPPDLLNKIMSQIKTERARSRAIWRFGLSSAIGLFLIWPTAAAWSSLASEFFVSGFSQYARLAFTDFGAIAANWQDYTMSLLESFPILNAATLLLSALALLVSANFVIEYGRRFSAISHLKPSHR